MAEHPPVNPSFEGLKWLDLSTPSLQPAAVKPVEASQPPCPTCGWPVAAGAAACDHCGHSLVGQAPPDLLAGFELQLLPAEIEVLPVPERWLENFSPEPLALYRLRLEAERLRVTTGFDRLICLDDINVDHYQHQLEAALRALRDMRGRALLADEVGLGKTIEAGIVMKELIERGLAETILILTPASLTWQWHEEMETKFHERFVVLEALEQLDGAGEERCRWIISLDRAKSPGWAEKLSARAYDLLIVDEAHKLKNHRTQAYRFVSGLRNHYMLMLTATPVHNNLSELYNLVSLLRPGHLGTRRAFRQNFVTSTPVTPTTPSKRRPGRRTIYGYGTNYDVPEYFKKPQAARQQYRQEAASRGASIEKWTGDFADFEGLKLTWRGQKAAEEVKQLLAQGYEVFDFEAIQEGSQGNYSFVCRLKLKEQPRPKRQPRPERRTVPRNPAVLRQLLQEVMIRNRRASVGVRFPPRQAAVYNLNLTPPEQELYEKVTTYIWKQLQVQARQPDQTPRGSLKMTLMALQKQLCSSPQAAARMLKNLVEQQSEAELAEALILAWGIHQGRKVTATLDLLNHYPGKFLIFTDYLPTLEALQGALNQAGHETVVFHGGLSAAERVETVRAFRHNPAVRVMISTQSGSEGHNLQFCQQMINYDLPWNPMRIEQRVGRLHRLGQPEAVSIFNLSANNTIEAYILDLLAHKIRMFELVIGELDLILGELGEQRSFEQFVEDIWAKSYSEAELKQMMAELEAIILKARGTYEEVRSASDELSDLLWAFDEVHGNSHPE